MSARVMGVTKVENVHLVLTWVLSWKSQGLSRGDKVLYSVGSSSARTPRTTAANCENTTARRSTTQWNCHS